MKSLFIKLFYYEIVHSTYQLGFSGITEFQPKYHNTGKPHDHCLLVNLKTEQGARLAYSSTTDPIITFTQFVFPGVPMINKS